MAEIQFPVTQPGSSSFSAVMLNDSSSPSTVLAAHLDLTIHADWMISSQMALMLGGQWEIAAYADSVGPGPHKQIGPTVTIPVSGETHYSADIVVPADTLPVLDRAAPSASATGAYRIVILLNHRNFGRLTDVIGIVESPLVRIG